MNTLIMNDVSKLENLLDMYKDAQEAAIANRKKLGDRLAKQSKLVDEKTVEKTRLYNKWQEAETLLGVAIANNYDSATIEGWESMVESTKGTYQNFLDVLGYASEEQVYFYEERVAAITSEITGYETRIAEIRDLIAGNSA